MRTERTQTKFSADANAGRAASGKVVGLQALQGRMVERQRVIVGTSRRFGAVPQVEFTSI
jgi:hypothetical protein